jgi:predicted CXXCH cytochrome family protein
MIAGLLWLACGGGEAESPLAVEWPGIAAEVRSQVVVPATYPSDLLVRADGSVWVLDGYRGQIVPIGPDGVVGAPFGGVEEWGHPVRLASAASGGAWLVDPAGRLLEIDPSGRTVRVVPVAATDQATVGGPPAGPVSVLEDEGLLVVSDRHGRVTWMDPGTGTIRREKSKAAEDEAFGTITDILRTPDGALVLADAVAGRIHRLGADDSWRSFGRYGLWIGTMKQPKAVLAEGAGYWIADTALGAVQLFADDGSGRGVLMVDGEPLALRHPIALDRTATRELLVLEAATSTVWKLGVDPRAVERSLRVAPRRFQRKSLVSTDDAGAAGDDGQICLQCHDGLVNDSRFVWDGALARHPLHEKPEEKLPAIFTLDEEGGLACVTCHSPHGTSTLADVVAVEQGADRDLLVRHVASEPFMRLSRDDSGLCIACHSAEPHEDAVSKLGIGGGAHPVGAALARKMVGRPGSDEEPQCVTCHAVHGGEGDGLLRSEGDGRFCVSCHEAEAAPGSAHATGLTGASTQPGPEIDAHLPLDQAGRATCRTCHDLAGGRAAALLRIPEDGGNLCGACHTEVLQDIAAGHSGVQGSSGISCLGCHDTHGAKHADGLLRDFGTHTAGDPYGCLGCHRSGGAGAAAGIVRGGHPVDGEAHPPMTNDPLTCGTCHDPHGPAAAVPACGECHADQAQAATRGGHGTATCVDCHPAHRDAPSAKISGLNPASQGCLGCHLDGLGGAPKLRSYDHPDLVFRPDGTRWTALAGLPLYAADGRPVASGQNGELTCSSCHETHGPNATDPGDNLRRPEWKAVCTSCHGNDALVLYRYFHEPERRSSVQEAP